MAISPEVLRQLVALYGSGGAGLPREYYDAATNTAYLPQYGTMVLPDGRIVAANDTRSSDDIANGLSAPLSGFAAYNRIPGSTDNIDLTGKPQWTFDTQGNLLSEDQMGGFHKNSPMDYLLPFAMVAAPFAAAAMGAGAAGAAGGAAGGAGGAAGGIAGLGDAGLMYAGADAAAAGTLGGGASIGGGAALSAGELAALASEFPALAPDLATSPMGAGGETLAAMTPEELAAIEEAAGAGLSFGAPTGADAVAAYSGLTGAVSPELIASSLGMTPEAFASMSGQTLGELGAANGMLNGTAAPSWLDKIIDDPSKLLGPASAIAGAVAGAEGQEKSTTAQQQLPDYLKGPVNDVVSRAQGLLNARDETAQSYGAQQYNVGSNLLANPVAGNGYGQVTLNAPTTSTNPYLSGMADDITRRTQEMLDQNNLSIQGRYAGMAGTGNTRQGVAQGVAAGKAADYMSGNLANLYGQQYNNDQNRALQQYGMDQGFYTSQRGQDLMGLGVGSDLITQGMQTQWLPLKNASDIYGKFSGFGPTTTSSQQGGGWDGGVGGLLAGAAFGKQMGWWG